MASNAAPLLSGFVYLRVIFLSLFFTSFIAVAYGFGVYLFGAVVPTMRDDIDLSYATVGLITASAQVGFLVTSLLCNRLSRLLGAGLLIHLSVGISGLCLYLLSRVDTALAAGILLVITGACAASAWTPMVSVVADQVKREHRGKVLGLIASGTSYGVFINGLIIPFFVTHYDWRALWATTGLAALALCAMSAILFRRTLFRSAGEENQTPTAEERMRRRKGIERRALLVWSLLFLSGLVCVPYQTYMVPFMQDDLGFGVGDAGEVYAASGLIGMAGGFLFGILADRTSIRAALLVAYAMVAAAVLLFASRSGYLPIFAGGFLFGFAFQAIFGLIPAYISKTIRSDRTIFVFGVGNVMLGLSSVVGNYAGGVVKEYTGSFSMLYWSMAVLMLAIFPISLRLSEGESPHRSPGAPSL